ncbi:MAG TPA: uroporphyrinogen decarboxylase [Saprospiraceae bacterium]|nr:uroporphyrinogen decarboxylase [Saprospiraceae bacterium]HMP25908.1 uroporphyrinogen decarboxylase [Saprospiraceae bacterium]
MKLQNDLLLRVARGESVERPPVWLMRQAGRILPEYRAVREQLRDFKELVTTPERAAEVTIQPVDILGVDAAIIFSDILVIPEALGLDYEMVEKKGPAFPRTIATPADVEALRSGEEAAEHLQYVYDALRVTKEMLNGRVPLIGFCGAPWTLLAYMVEGSGSKTFSRAKKFLYTQPTEAHALLQKITDASIAYLKRQIAHGADLVQIFDSWAGILGPQQYREFSAPYIAQICNAIQEAPVTVFAKGAWFALEDFARMDCQVIGLDWTMDPEASRRRVGERPALQGNLDPCCLYASPDYIRQQTQAMLAAFGGRHIANLGHGVYPDTPLAGVRAFIEAVQAFRYEY